MVTGSEIVHQSMEDLLKKWSVKEGLEPVKKIHFGLGDEVCKKTSILESKHQIRNLKIREPLYSKRN